VLVEKPLARDSAECRELIRIADQAGLLLVPVHQFIFQRGFRRATAAISQLGRILHVDATICSAGGEHAPTQVDDIAGEILPHPLSLIERLVPGLLKSARWTMRRPAAGEWRVSTDSQGVSISILISLHARPTEASLRVAMEGGMVEVDLFHGFATIDTAPASRAAKISRPFRTSARQFGTAAANLTRRIAAREGAYPGLRTLIFEFYEAVRGRREAPIRADEILAVAAARDRIVELATEQQTRGAS
jgi:predicted dehydrogenase